LKANSLMSSISTRTTYLEMFAPPAQEIALPRTDVHVRHIAAPGIDEYRHLYRSVGSQLTWVDRLLMPDEELRSILADNRVEVFVLEVAGMPAGYAELDRRTAGEIELAYFGLFPEFIGQGLGKFLLNWILRKAWSYQPARVWVHTCDLDHPAALPNYLQAGLRIYDEHNVVQRLSGDT
jgi:GNAT superfamily N-acetyltransferase